MQTIASAVERAVAVSPQFGPALLEDIVNYSALARRLRPAVEALLLEEVTEGAVTIALKRHAAQLRKRKADPLAAHPARTFALRGGLTAMIYRNSPTLQDIHRKLLTLDDGQEAFVHFAQGSHESSFLVSANRLATLRALAKRETLAADYPALSALSVRMPPEVMTLPGVFSPFVQTLAWQRISVYQIVSHFTEITFVVEDADADRAFAAVKGAAGAPLRR